MNLEVFRNYSLQHLKKDILSGIVVGIIAIPLGLGFAIASGISPVTGLYTTIVAGLLIAILGGCRFQIAGPTGAFVPVLLGIVLQYGYENLLIAGFQSGIALIIFSGQIPNFLGLHAIEKYQYFHLNIKEIFGNLHFINIYSIA